VLADPQEPQFFASYLFSNSSQLSSRLGTVGFGQIISLAKGSNWQVSIAPAALSQFDMHSYTNDLINTDYLLGLLFAYRRDAWSSRFRVLHQSSHLGDGYIVHDLGLSTSVGRLSFEAAEILAARDFGPWRVYGGGEYIFRHIPALLRPGVAHAGFDYRGEKALVRLGRVGTGRFVAGLDGRSIQDQGWALGWNLVAGLELQNPAALPGTGWRWSLLLNAHTGVSSYGLFFRDRLSSLGVGIAFAP